MFERFTERARQVVVLAQDEARGLGHPHIGTEHLLLGLLREEEGIANRILESLGVTVEETRAQVERTTGRGEEVRTGQMPFTPEAKRTLELSLREALGLGHNYIGTEHLLLALVREHDGVGARILLDLGISPGTVRDAVHATIGGVPLPPPRGERSMVSFTAPSPARDWVPTLAAGVFLAVGLAAGILLGWAIWG